MADETQEFDDDFEDEWVVCNNCGREFLNDGGGLYCCWACEEEANGDEF